MKEPFCTHCCCCCNLKIGCSIYVGLSIIGGFYEILGVMDFLTKIKYESSYGHDNSSENIFNFVKQLNLPTCKFLLNLISNFIVNIMA